MPLADSKNFRDIPCEICGSENFSEVCVWNGVSRVVRCRDCGLQFVNPMPVQNYLDALYEKETQNGGGSNPFYRSYIQERTDRWRSYRKKYNERLKRIESLYHGTGRLLDIGCGGGFFLKAARERGWDPYGIDIVPEFVRFAKEELHLGNVQCAPLQQASWPSAFFDVIVLWDLIEHLPHPRPFLERCGNLLKPGGLLVIWTPNVKNAALLKEKWYGYRIEQHLFFYCSETLKRMLAPAGFDIVYENTNRAKKGFFSSPENKPYRKEAAPASRLAKRLKGIRRDLKNSLNPVNYISPLLDGAGYGFNLYVIGRKNRPGSASLRTGP